MIHVLGCLFEQHDLRLVVLAAGLCGIACVTAVTMIARARAADPGRARLAWLVSAGAAAGCGVWATHFIAMLAYRTGLPLHFDPGLTILSVTVAVALCGLGFALAVEKSGALGGAVAGGAIVLMHYTGMAAVEIPARAVWNSGAVIASALAGIGLAGVGLHLARRGGRSGVALGAGLFALAILAVHFTGMSAVTFIPDGARAQAAGGLDTFALAVVVGAGAAFVVTQGLIVALVDRHLSARAKGEAARMRDHIATLEATLRKLKETSNELTRALGAAARADQAKASFLASMSHELRTPLNAIIGFSDTMVMEVFGPLGERYKGYAGDIRHSGEHLLALINDVLDLSRLDAGQAELREEDFDPAELISESLRMMVGQAAKAQILLTTHVAQALPWVTADKRRIKQIVINLVSNALKFTPAGGTVDIAAGLTQAGDLAIAVADSGIGIAPEDLPRVMERFGQVDSPMQRKHEGTGLGLPLSRQLAQLHGGDLVLESAVEQGTTVTLTLPRARLSVAGPAVAIA